jgi:hypothetical protein
VGFPEPSRRGGHHARHHPVSAAPGRAAHGWTSHLTSSRPRLRRRHWARSLDRSRWLTLHNL